MPPRKVLPPDLEKLRKMGITVEGSDIIRETGGRGNGQKIGRHMINWDSRRTPNLKIPFLATSALKRLQATVPATLLLPEERFIESSADEAAEGSILLDQGKLALWRDPSYDPVADSIYEHRVFEPYIFSEIVSDEDFHGESKEERFNDLVDAQEVAAASIIKSFNHIYLYGVANRGIYGFLNDPRLPNPILPSEVVRNGEVTHSWLWKNSELILSDVNNMFQSLADKNGGLVQKDTSLILAVSPVNERALNHSHSGSPCACELLERNFSNLSVVTIKELETPMKSDMAYLYAPYILGEPSGLMLYGDRFNVSGPFFREGENLGLDFYASTLGCLIRFPKAFARMIFLDRFRFNLTDELPEHYLYFPPECDLQAGPVTVALKLHCGLELELPGGRKVFLNGAHSDSVRHSGKSTRYNHGGYNKIQFGLTPRVRPDDWLYISRISWLQNLMYSGFLFAAPNLQTAEEESARRVNLFHGYEPIL